MEKVFRLLEDPPSKFCLKKPLDINFTHPAISLNGTFDNLCIEGFDKGVFCMLDRFNILFTCGPFVHPPFDLFNITFPHLNLTGNYNLTGNLGDLFDVFGIGPFSLNLTDVEVYAKNVNCTANFTKACIDNISVNVSISAVDNYFYNLMNDTEIEHLFNKVIKEILPETVFVIWNEIKEWTEPYLQYFLDHLFDNKTLQADWTRDISAERGLQGKHVNKRFPICYNI